MSEMSVCVWRVFR